MDQQHPKPVRKPIRAAQYVRMSTDLQQYSTQNQADAIAAYAAQHKLTIVREYADEPPCLKPSLINRHCPANTLVESSLLYSPAIARFRFLTMFDIRLPSLRNGSCPA